MTNQRAGLLGAAITGTATALFALSMLAELIAGLSTMFLSQLICIFIALGYVVFASSVTAINRGREYQAAGTAGIAFSAVYAVLILIVYYAGVTTVSLVPTLSDETLSIISYARAGSLFFNYDLLGYGMMALSTFFVGFTVRPETKGDRVFRVLLWVHGFFFPVCLALPMLGIFRPGDDAMTGTLVLELWCLYFLPLCVLGYRYIKRCARAGQERAPARIDT